jgi:hypothetical protein
MSWMAYWGWSVWFGSQSNKEQSFQQLSGFIPQTMGRHLVKQDANQGEVMGTRV